MINEQIIDNVINKILHEAFARRNGNNLTNKQSKTAGQIKIAGVSHAEREVKKDDNTTMQIEYAVVVLVNVYENTKKDLIKAINQIGTIITQDNNGNQVQNKVFTLVDRKMTDVLFLYCDLALKNYIPDLLEKIENFIISMPAYREKSEAIKEMCGELYDAVDSVASKSEVEAQKRLAYENWENMLQQLKDPEVRSRLRRYNMAFLASSSVGHILSPGNIKRIFDVRPDATFVVEKRTWEKDFNRTIKPGAIPILVSKPTDRRFLSKNSLDNAARNKGYSDYDSAIDITNGATQVNATIKTDANGYSNHFAYVKMYDVADTIPPSNPEDDVFTIKYGLKNNLTGEVNEPAQNFIDNMNDNNISADASQSDISRIKAICYVLKTYCEKNGIELNFSLYDEGKYENFINYVIGVIATTKAKVYGFLRPKDVENFKALSIIALCSVWGVAYNSNYEYVLDIDLKHRNQNNREGDINISLTQSVYTMIDEIVPKINKIARDVDQNNIVAETSNNFIKGYFMEEYKRQIMSETKINNFIKQNQVNGKINIKDFLNFCKKTIPTIPVEEDENNSENK